MWGWLVEGWTECKSKRLHVTQSSWSKEIVAEKDQRNSEYLTEKKKQETWSRIIDGYSDRKSKRLPTFQNGEVMTMSKDTADDGK